MSFILVPFNLSSNFSLIAVAISTFFPLYVYFLINNNTIKLKENLFSSTMHSTPFFEKSFLFRHSFRLTKTSPFVFSFLSIYNSHRLPFRSFSTILHTRFPTPYQPLSRIPLDRCNSRVKEKEASQAILSQVIRRVHVTKAHVLLLVICEKASSRLGGFNNKQLALGSHDSY